MRSLRLVESLGSDFVCSSSFIVSDCNVFLDDHVMWLKLKSEWIKVQSNSWRRVSTHRSLCERNSTKFNSKTLIKQKLTEGDASDVTGDARPPFWMASPGSKPTPPFRGVHARRPRIFFFFSWFLFSSSFNYFWRFFSLTTFVESPSSLVSRFLCNY